MDGGITGRRFSYRRDGRDQPVPLGGRPRGSVLVRRSPEELRTQPDKLNLDERGLEVCPTVEGEELSLRLLSLKGNRIACLGLMGRLSALVFLDLYGNRLTSLDGPLDALPNLRVLMVGRNRLRSLQNLRGNLPRLDVLDVHGNELEDLDGLESCRYLRVLNLASNRIRFLGPVRGLGGLTELNLRRNTLSAAGDLSGLTNLLRLNLSGNALASVSDLAALSSLRRLTELSIEENPVAGAEEARRLLEALLPPPQPNSASLPLADAPAAGETSPVSPPEVASDDLAETDTSLSTPVQTETVVVALAAVSSAEDLAGVLDKVEQGQLRVLALEFAGLHRRRIHDFSKRIASSFGSIRKLRLYGNDINSFSELKHVLELFPCLSSLHLEANGVCQSSMLRSFCNALLPQLTLFECSNSTIASGSVGTESFARTIESQEPEKFEGVRVVCTVGIWLTNCFSQIVEAAVRDIVHVMLTQMKK